ncbi:PREDICTED: uncharacterized protein LOC106741267 isoform X2 [Dinoponera quadriceps]|uniref:Uncharacterized protein LOC106741267 isoform X2 n=1 Tax=Dinoponera quadriceps TaxID=609295 RepID=A0A6P3WR62_DINQU|nr:PREDICTED: uncharacterized protein LOC106741267 isoform X2 [Dinoponera quadriceps]
MCFRLISTLGYNFLYINLKYPCVSRTMDVPSVENLLNRRPDGWSSPQSPDELVIQKRGRRRNIVWSPDLDANKRNNLLSLSSRERTPVKNPQASRDLLRNPPKKRLSLIDIYQSEFITPEKKRKTHSIMSDTNISQEQSVDNLTNSLRGLSHEQLVQMIMNVIHMQENDSLFESATLRNIFLKKMPIADIQPLMQKLNVFRQNIYASLICSNLDDSAYSRAYIHLDMFEKTLVEQGTLLQESQHWMSLMNYVLAAWEIVRELPEWENQGHQNTTHRCFKSLSQFCIQAIRRENFETSHLEIYIEKLEAIAGQCEDFKICLQMAKEAKEAKQKS